MTCFWMAYATWNSLEQEKCCWQMVAEQSCLGMQEQYAALSSISGSMCTQNYIFETISKLELQEAIQKIM